MSFGLALLGERLMVITQPMHKAAFSWSTIALLLDSKNKTDWSCFFESSKVRLMFPSDKGAKKRNSLILGSASVYLVGSCRMACVSG